MFRMPVSGSLVKTSGSVMKGPPSSGHVLRIGSWSSPPSTSTTSWHGASLTVLGIKSANRLASGSIFKASMNPLGMAGVVSSSISLAISSSVSTPSARQMRDDDPKRLAATGIVNPVGRSKRSAGPPPGDLAARSTTAAISRSGLTAAETRESSRRRSSSVMNEVMSANMGESYGVRSPARQSRRPRVSPGPARVGRRPQKPAAAAPPESRRRNPRVRGPAARRASPRSCRPSIAGRSPAWGTSRQTSSSCA